MPSRTTVAPVPMPIRAEWGLYGSVPLAQMPVPRSFLTDEFEALPSSEPKLVKQSVNVLPSRVTLPWT